MRPNDRILITGANGMVGQSLLPLLKKKGYRNLLTPRSKELDLLDQRAVNSYFKAKRPVHLIHLAARVGGIQANIQSPSEFLLENLVMSMNVLGAARSFGVQKTLNLGSSCIYPTHSRQPMKEEYLLSGKLEPTNEGYALSKICALKLCEYNNRQYGTDCISLMPPNLYGPGDHFEPRNSHVISALILKFHEAKLARKPFVEVWGTGKARREFLYVADAAQAILFFMEKYRAKDLPPFLNIGPGKDISIKDLARTIARIAGYQGRILFDRSKPDGMMRKCLDVGLARKKGWKARTGLEEGLRKTYRWFLKNKKA